MSPSDPQSTRPQSTRPPAADHYDVVILGGGLAGLTLARHLLLATDRKVLLLERRAELPAAKQKVGESSVQLAGYYFSRVLDLEEYLWRRHFMKYNLRFYWPSAKRDNTHFEDYGQGYIRNFSNIASYQLDRNAFEAELLQRNRRRPERYTDRLGATGVDVTLAEDGPHRVDFNLDGVCRSVTADWVVDSTGRQRLLAKTLDGRRDNSIRHGAFFWWVDGTIDLDKLTDLPPEAIRKKPERRFQGHLPTWLATNHFCAEGLWFWVIPLQGKTSLGLVYDSAVLDHDDVFSVKKATEWVCEAFPLFARDLPRRKVLDFGGYRDFSYDCAQTISPARWAVTGEAGRFSDPLYSPGSDLIAIYNTLVVDAIQTGDPEALASKAALYEQMMRAAYGAYEPSYAESYDALGDQETFTLKYSWELAVYFGFYVFPFINDLYTDRRFLVSFLKAFSRLGPINAGLHRLLSDYFQWKKKHAQPPPEPVFFDFSTLAPLAAAERTFYEVGVSTEQARAVLTDQFRRLEEFARFITARVASVVLDAPEILTHQAFVDGLDPRRNGFDAEGWRARWEAVRGTHGRYPWTFDPTVLDAFEIKRRPAAEGAATS